jgi:hypothetical protein
MKYKKKRYQQQVCKARGHGSSDRYTIHPMLPGARATSIVSSWMEKNDGSLFFRGDRMTNPGTLVTKYRPCMKNDGWYPCSPRVSSDSTARFSTVHLPSSSLTNTDLGEDAQLAVAAFSDPNLAREHPKTPGRW